MTLKQTQQFGMTLIFQEAIGIALAAEMARKLTIGWPSAGV